MATVSSISLVDARKFTLLRFQRMWSFTLKMAKLMSLPLPATALMTILWYYVFYERDVHIPDGTLDIAVAAWIPFFGILYAVFSTMVIDNVINKYMSMRLAVKSADIETFMNLRDEDVSPIMHGLMTLLALAVIGGFMYLHYPGAGIGILVNASTTYLLALMFWVVREIDNPFTGIWVIRNIHKPWLEIDPKSWRERRLSEKESEWVEFITASESNAVAP